MKLSVLITAGASALVIAGCGGSSNPANNGPAPVVTNAAVAGIQPPSYHVGQSWTYLYSEFRADGTKKIVSPTYTITAVNPDGSYTVDYSDPTGYFTNGKETFNPAHAQVSDSLSSTPNLCTYTPPMVEVKFPLSSNDKWANDTILNCASGSSTRFVTSHSTNVQSSTTVKAGTFTGGYSISASGNITSTGINAPITTSYYYAPSVGAVVSRTTVVGGSTVTSELVSFVP